MTKGEKFEYKFNEDNKILFKYYFGLITIDDITNSWKFALKNNLIPENVKGFILDYRNATFRLSVIEQDEIPKFYKKHLNIFGNKRIAILTESPKDIVVPMLVSQKDEGYESRPFSTLEAATNWVLLF